MRVTALILVLAAALMCVALATRGEPAPATQPATVPADWVEVAVGKAFSMRLPPDFKERKVRGEDSAVAEYHNDAITLESDYGLYSDPLKETGLAKYQKAALSVGGKSAIIVTFEQGTAAPFCAAIHFADVGHGKTKLTVVATCKDAAAQKLAKRIFETITFP